MALEPIITKILGMDLSDLGDVKSLYSDYNITNVNNVTDTGFYYVAGGSSHIPVGYSYLLVIKREGTGVQFAINVSQNKAWFRSWTTPSGGSLTFKNWQLINTTDTGS